MKRQEIDEFIKDSAAQMEATYKYFDVCVAKSKDSVDETDQNLINAMITLKLTDNAESAQVLLDRVRTGMQDAEKYLNENQDQLSTEGLRESLKKMGIVEEESSLAGTGQLVELRKVLLKIVESEAYDAASKKARLDTQRFTDLSEQDQLDELSDLYQKTLEKTVKLSIGELDYITDAVPNELGQQIDDNAALLYAISIVKVLKDRDIPTDDLLETIGNYTYTSVYITNEKLQKEIVDPVISEETMRIISLILSFIIIAVTAIIFGGQLFNLKNISFDKFVDYFTGDAMVCALAMFLTDALLRGINKILTMIKQHRHDKAKINYIQDAKQTIFVDEQIEPVTV